MYGLSFSTININDNNDEGLWSGTDEAPAQMGSCFHGKQNQWNFGSCWLEESFYLFCSMICLLPENQKIS